MFRSCVQWSWPSGLRYMSSVASLLPLNGRLTVTLWCFVVRDPPLWDTDEFLEHFIFLFFFPWELRTNRFQYTHLQSEAVQSSFSDRKLTFVMLMMFSFLTHVNSRYVLTLRSYLINWTIIYSDVFLIFWPTYTCQQKLNTISCRIFVRTVALIYNRLYRCIY